MSEYRKRDKISENDRKCVLAYEREIGRKSSEE